MTVVTLGYFLTFGGIIVKLMSLSLIDFFLSYPVKKYKKSEVMLNMDVLAHPYLYYVEQGYVRVYTLLSTGTQKIYIFYKPGEIFPIIWTFNNINKHLFYEAMDDVILRKAPREEFLKFIQNKPPLLLDVIHRIVDIHNIYVDRVDNLEYTNSYARLIARLLSLGKRFGEEKENGLNILIPVTHSDIANSVAMTRETVSREIERLEKKQLVAKVSKLIVLRDIKKLQKELENSMERNYL